MLENLTIEDLDEEDIVLAELIGLGNFIKLVKVYGGGRIYIKKHDTLTKKARDKEILENFDGGNYNELAKKYDLSESMVRSIIGEDFLKKNQLSLF